MKIGIWLPIWPLSDWKYEGLTRLLGFVLSGIDPEREETYWLFVPYWVADKDMEEFLGKFTPAQRSKIHVMKPGGRNIVLMVAIHLMALRNEAGRLQRRIWRKKKFVSIKRYGRAKKLLLAMADQMRLSFIGVIFTGVLAIMAIPLAVIVGVAGVVFKVSKQIINVIRRLFGRAENLEENAPFSLKTILLKPIHKILGAVNPAVFVHDLANAELDRMARSASRQVKADCWYVPHIGYKSGIHLAKPRVFLFPDFVFHDAPTGFSSEAVSQAKRNMQHTLSHAQHIVAISNHVAQRHLAGVFDYPQGKVSVVQHGYVDICGLLPFLKEEENENSHALTKVIKTPDNLGKASHIIKEGLAKIFAKNRHKFGPIYKDMIFPYIRRIDFSRTKYVIVSTQNRPYKNTLCVIKAIEKYNNTASDPLKLIMTGTSGIDTPGDMIGDYIRSRGLYFDILSIPRIPDKAHAALYHCAELAIAASFFEGGGGSFVFDEAVSVGTPTLLSKNHSHNEGFQHEIGFQSFSFDPYSPEDLSLLIDKTLSEGAQTLYEIQWKMANSRAHNRSWRHTTNDYLKIFRTTAIEEKRGRM